MATLPTSHRHSSPALQIPSEVTEKRPDVLNCHAVDRPTEDLHTWARNQPLQALLDCLPIHGVIVQQQPHIVDARAVHPLTVANCTQWRQEQRRGLKCQTLTKQAWVSWTVSMSLILVFSIFIHSDVTLLTHRNEGVVRPRGKPPPNPTKQNSREIEQETKHLRPFENRVMHERPIIIGVLVKGR